MSQMHFTNEQLNNFDFARSLEWMETDGLGGYASSTISGSNSRRYHGLLVTAMKPPVDRKVVLSKLDETIISEGNRFELSSNQFPGAIHPKGFQYLKAFKKDLFPVFLYEVAGLRLQKTIASIQGENTTVVLYEVVGASPRFKMELLSLCSCRDFHSLSHANDSIYRNFIFNDGVFQTKNYIDSPELFISVPGSTFEPGQTWYSNFEYSVEQERGLDFQEDLFNHGKFTVELKKGDKLGIIISTEDPSRKDAFSLFKKEKKRRESLVQNFSWNENIKSLTLAADQFIVKRDKDLETIIAGYHWFADWGRDTMISLPGLCLVTGRFEHAKKILQSFIKNISEGMLPNRFLDYGEAAEYNNVDATLWLYYSVYKYYQYTADKDFIKKILPSLNDIVDWHYKGTRYNIHVDKDELLYAGQEGVQLTWMDAKVGDWVVTPRRGKAVEINALWFNALCVMAELLYDTGEIEKSNTFKERAGRVSKSFNAVFWNEKMGCLYDYIDGDFKNEDIRPNQIFALSLPSPLLTQKKAMSVLEVVTQKLLTPRGLRSLSTDHNDYKPHYMGDQWHRDGEYHQGTVWSFLLGPYIDALVNLKGAKGKAEAFRLLNSFFEHLSEAGVGTISEIFDGEPPHHPRGCIAQAWGVGEILRVAIEHDIFLQPDRK